MSADRMRLCLRRLAIGFALWIELVPEALADSPEATRTFRHGVVAADHPLASEAGAEILRQGGNVVDAAVATAFSLSVLRPEGCGIGGGGFMLIWNADSKQAVAIDYRERAPSGATRDMYLSNDSALSASRRGGLAIALPGDVAGLCHALEHYGTMDLKTVLAPAIRLAKTGVPVDAFMRSSQQSVLKQFQQHPEYKQRFPTLWKLYLNSGQAWKPGDRFHSPLVNVLTRIAESGPPAFYQGEVAAAIANEIERQGGIITKHDLANVQPVVVREPIRTNYHGHEILSMPPPSSGGIALIEMLKILQAYEQTHPQARLNDIGHDSSAYFHLLAETMKHAFADRAEYLGDADYVDVPAKRLMNESYAKRLAAKIDPTRTYPLDHYGRAAPINDAGTSHFCVIDQQGNAVACTETINTYFGSFVVEPRFGIVLNNEMDDFAAVPGRPNAFGLIQSENNAVAAGKKPLSSMTPTIVLRNGQARFVVGGSGGPRIISATLQVLLNMTRFGMPPQQAVDVPRIHHQWLPEILYVETGIKEHLRRQLRQKGHEIEERTSIATVQAAARTKDGLTGACDRNKGGRPAGW